MIISHYASGQMLDWLLDAQTPTAIPTVYFALYTVAPTVSGGGTEVSASSYSRVALTRGFTRTDNVAANLVTIQWATPTESWGTIVAAGMLDAATGGNLLAADTFSGQAVGIGETPRILANTNMFTFTAS